MEIVELTESFRFPQSVISHDNIWALARETWLHAERLLTSGDIRAHLKRFPSTEQFHSLVMLRLSNSVMLLAIARDMVTYRSQGCILSYLIMKLPKTLNT